MKNIPTAYLSAVLMIVVTQCPQGYHLGVMQTAQVQELESALAQNDQQTEQLDAEQGNYDPLDVRAAQNSLAAQHSQTMSTLMEVRDANTACFPN